jgi:hypothetical protein
MTNRYETNCNECRQPVPVGTGTLSRTTRARRTFWLVTCPDCTAGALDRPSEALAWSRGNDVSYGVVTSTGWRGTRNRNGRCEDAPCCGCCSF